MEFNELKKALAAEAKEKGICKEWYNFIMQAPDKKRLMTLFVKGLDFCIEKDYPSAALRAEFEDIRNHYGVFVSDKISVRATGAQTVIAFGTSEGEAHFTGYSVGRIWARDNTRLTINAEDCSIVSVEVADEAEITVKASDAAKVTIFHHGGKYATEAGSAAQIKVIDKTK